MNPITPNIGIIGSSPRIMAAIERLREVAPTDLSVLITGESGTGKEVFAQAIHALSKRRMRRMVSINCGAIPEQLLESELFGSEKGAFTGATEQRKGFFEAADHSTIFLDELGEMPIGTQVKLLRVLESGEFSRLGSPETLRTDVRVIAATNRRLEEEVAQGTFRRDLYYRLNTVQIELPPLREHPEDIPELIDFFAQRTATKIGVSFEGVLPEAMRILQQLPWTGNIRELRNMIETLVTLGKGRTISTEMLLPYLPKALKEPNLREPDRVFESFYGSQNLALSSHPLSSHQVLPQAVMTRLLPSIGTGNSGTVIPPPIVAPNPHETASAITPQTLIRVPNKTPEQVERELMYKALLDLVREVASLRGEISEIKDVLYANTNTSIPVTHTKQASAHEASNHLPVEPLHHVPQKEQSQDLELPTESVLEPLTMQAVEKRLIIAALEQYKGNRRQTAEALGISERTLYRKLHEYGLG